METLAQMRQMNRLVPQSRPWQQLCVLNQPSVQVFGEGAGGGGLRKKS